MKDRLVLVIVICTLASVMAAVIGVLLAGLFHSVVDNTEIFKILGPAFQTIVGAFVGVLGGRAMRDSENK